MEDYKPNSHRYREGAKPGESREEKALPEKKVEKVVSGAVRTKKKTGLQKFAAAFIQEDVADIKSFIFTDIMIPACKKFIQDAVDALLYPGGNNPRRTGGSRPYNAYGSAYRRDDRREPERSARSKSIFDYDDLVFDDRRDADELLLNMDELMSAYGIVSVLDMYDLAGVNCSYTARNWGWTDIRNARVIRMSDGSYALDMPKALPINK